MGVCECSDVTEYLSTHVEVVCSECKYFEITATAYDTLSSVEATDITFPIPDYTAIAEVLARTWSDCTTEECGTSSE